MSTDDRLRQLVEAAPTLSCSSTSAAPSRSSTARPSASSATGAVNSSAAPSSSSCPSATATITSGIAFMRERVDDLASVELVTAPTAEIGLELVRSRRPAVVLMDINLPGINGFEATRRLAEWPETRGIPVVALTAAAMPRDAKRAAEAGFYCYLTKPVKVDELTHVLEELLEPEPK